MPGIAPYSAAKGAMERWGESMAGEVAPFGIGVTVLIAGTYDTDIITDAGTTDDRNFDGPYARLHSTMNCARPVRDQVRPPTRDSSPMDWSRRWTTAGLFAVTAWDRMRRCCWRPADSAGRGNAPHVPAGHGHSSARLDARRGLPVDDCAEGDGVRREGASPAGSAAVSVAGDAVFAAAKQPPQQGSDNDA